MHVFVVGGTRFIGPHVVRRLAASGHRVTVFHRGKTEAELPDGVERVLGDRAEMEARAGELRALAPDVVLDMIPFKEADALAVVRTFAGVARRAIAVSSVDVYLAYDAFRGVHAGPAGDVPFDETAPLRTELYPYRSMAKSPDELFHSYDKILVERAYASDARIAATALRLPFVYGPGDNQHRLFEYLKRMDDGREKIVLGERRAGWRSSRGYVEDVAAAIALAATDERAAGRTYNVAEPDALAEADWVARIGEAAGWEGEVATLPDDRLPEHLRDTYDWSRDLVADTRAIREELGFAESVLREEALARTVAWERENPPATVDAAQFDYEAEDAALEES